MQSHEQYSRLLASMGLGTLSGGNQSASHACIGSRQYTSHFSVSMTSRAQELACILSNHKDA